jgi:hypothetical protein
MNYLKKALQASYRTVRTDDPDGQEITIVPPIRNGRDLANALDMPKSTLFRWIDNPALRQFTDEQLQILHNQLHWRQVDFDGNQVLHIKQTKDLLERDLEADQNEGKQGEFGRDLEDLIRELPPELRLPIRKSHNRQMESAVKRSLEESTARLNMLTEQFRVSQIELAEASEKLHESVRRIKELEKNLDFAQMVAHRYHQLDEEVRNLREQIEKKAS